MYASNKSSCFRREGARLMDGLANIVDIPGQCHGPVTTQDWEGHCVSVCVCVWVCVHSLWGFLSLLSSTWAVGIASVSRALFDRLGLHIKSHPPIYLMCSSTRMPSIHPQGARISKHSNSLGVAISTRLELYSQIPKSLCGLRILENFKARKEGARCGFANYLSFNFISFKV